MRKFFILRASFFILAAVLLLGCERRPLELLLVDKGKIPVRIDWNKARLNPDTDTENLYRASVWFFSKDGTLFDDGKTYREFRLDDPRGGEVDLPIGRYSVLVFNNSVDDFSGNVGFRGTDGYDTFEYYVRPDRSVQTEENRVLEPDILAAWRLDDYEVTAAMIIHSHILDIPLTEAERIQAEKDLKRLLHVVPERLTYTVHTKACVRHLKSARAAHAKLNGMAHSVSLASGKVSSTASSFAFDMSNRQYIAEDSPHGTIEARFETLGLLEDTTAAYTVDLKFTLVDKHEGSETYPTPPAAPFRFNVAGQVRRPVSEEDKAAGIDIKIRLGRCFWGDPDDPDNPDNPDIPDDPDDPDNPDNPDNPDDPDNPDNPDNPGEEDDPDNPEIILPDLYVPGGFLPDVGDWGEEYPIDIPIHRYTYRLKY